MYPIISGSLSTRHGEFLVYGWRNGLQVVGYLRIYRISSRGGREGMFIQLEGWARYLQLLTLKTGLIMKRIHVSQAWTEPLVRPKQWKRDVRFSTWNVRSLCRSGSLPTVARELARYKLDLLGAQEVSWDRGAL
jgi:hypothetical protein